VAALLLWWGPSSARRGWLLVQQLGMGAFVVTALVPMVELGDRLRQLPIRRMASLALEQQRPQEPLAMVGILKPSLHYYTQQVVVYEGVQPNGPLNLNDRLAKEQRRGQQPSPASLGASVLVVIDGNTATLPHWRGVPHQRLGTIGLYELWRVPRPALNQWSKDLAERAGLAPDWQEPRPERY
jgi:hypothetical protein